MIIFVLECDPNANEWKTSNACPICFCKAGFAGSGNNFIMVPLKFLLNDENVVFGDKILFSENSLFKCANTVLDN